MAKEKKAFVPKSYHSLVKKAAFEPKEGTRYALIGADIYALDMKSDEYIAARKARLAKRAAKVNERIEKRAKRIEIRAAKKAKKNAAKELNKEKRRQKILARAEARAAAI